MSRYAATQRLFYDLKCDLAMILSGAKSGAALKRAASDRCNALSELLGLDFMMDEVRDAEQIRADLDNLLDKQFNMSRKEAAEILDKAMDEQFQASRKQGRRMAGGAANGINRGM